MCPQYVRASSRKQNGISGAALGIQASQHTDGTKYRNLEPRCVPAVSLDARESGRRLKEMGFSVLSCFFPYNSWAEDGWDSRIPAASSPR